MLCKVDTVCSMLFLHLIFQPEIKKILSKKVAYLPSPFLYKDFFLPPALLPV